MSYLQTLSQSQKQAYEEAHRFFGDQTHEKTYEELISAVSSLNCWLEYYVRTNRFAEEVSDFFAEAVNDAILAYSFARVGTWRPALQSLRSTLENTLHFLYYKDHPVELQLWQQQRHRLGFTELISYFKGHPLLAGFNHQSETGIVQLEDAYASLSKAVHGSVSYFRMVSKAPLQELPSIHVADPVELLRFRSTLRDMVEAMNQLLVAIFRESLRGAALPALRHGIAATVSASRRAAIKKSFSVSLLKSV
jgi:hypothetical protein